MDAYIGNIVESRLSSYSGRPSDNNNMVVLGSQYNNGWGNSPQSRGGVVTGAISGATTGTVIGGPVGGFIGGALGAVGGWIADKSF